MNHLFDRNFSAGILAEVCDRYRLAPDNITLIKEDSNLIYDCTDSILRISYSGTRSADEIKAEIDWMAFLHRNKVPVPAIFPSAAKGRMERIGNGTDHFTAVRFEKIRGRVICNESWNELHFQKLGRLTGLIHRTSQEYPAEDRLKFRHWDELVECSYAEALPADERELQRLNNFLMEGFRTYERDSEHYGLIHNDIHHENYLLTGGENKIVLFDFEVACRSWHLYEIATALYYACLVRRKRNDKDFERIFLRSFVRGYRTEHALPPVDFKMILRFMLYRDLFLYGYVAEMWRHKVPPASTTRYLELINTSIKVRRERLGL